MIYSNFTLPYAASASKSIYSSIHLVTVVHTLSKLFGNLHTARTTSCKLPSVGTEAGSLPLHGIFRLFLPSTCSNTTLPSYTVCRRCRSESDQGYWSDVNASHPEADNGAVHKVSQRLARARRER